MLSNLDEKKLDLQVLLQGFKDSKNFALEEFPIPVEDFINRYFVIKWVYWYMTWNFGLLEPQVLNDLFVSESLEPIQNQLWKSFQE